MAEPSSLCRQQQDHTRSDSAFVASREDGIVASMFRLMLCLGLLLRRLALDRPRPDRDPPWIAADSPPSFVDRCFSPVSGTGIDTSAICFWNPSSFPLRSGSNLMPSSSPDWWCRTVCRRSRKSHPPVAWEKPIGAIDDGADKVWLRVQPGPWVLVVLADFPETLYCDGFVPVRCYARRLVYWGRDPVVGGHAALDGLGWLGGGSALEMVMLGPWLIYACLGWLWFRDGFDIVWLAGSPTKEDPHNMD